MLRAFAFGLVLFASPAVATDFDWSKRANRVQMDIAFAGLANRCTIDLGFTRVPALPAETMSDKIEAYLLLKDAPDAQLERWGAMLRGWRSPDSEANVERLARRGSDAIGAAVADPAAYDQAEALYIETLLSPIREKLAACATFAADPFMSKYYLRGAGTASAYEAKARQKFASAVAETRAYKARLKQQ